MCIFFPDFSDKMQNCLSRALLESGWLFLFPCFLLLKGAWQYSVLLSWVYGSLRMKFTALNLPCTLWRQRVRKLKQSSRQPVWCRVGDGSVLRLSSCCQNLPSPEGLVPADRLEAGDTSVQSWLGYRWDALSFERVPKEGWHLHICVCVCVYVEKYIHTSLCYLCVIA